MTPLGGWMGSAVCAAVIGLAACSAPEPVPADAVLIAQFGASRPAFEAAVTDVLAQPQVRSIRLSKDGDATVLPEGLSPARIERLRAFMTAQGLWDLGSAERLDGSSGDYVAMTLAAGHAPGRQDKGFVFARGEPTTSFEIVPDTDAALAAGKGEADQVFRRLNGDFYIRSIALH